MPASDYQPDKSFCHPLHLEIKWLALMLDEFILGCSLISDSHIAAQPH